MAHAGGRPTKYKPEFIRLVDEYLKKTVDSVEVFAGGGQRIKVNLPSIEGFSQFLDVDKAQIYDWEKLNPQFNHALNKIRREQWRRLIDNGLAGTYNATIAKLILSCNHGMRENDNNVNVAIINKIDVTEKETRLSRLRAIVGKIEK